eukprot:symbB.v1.2.016655.t1/scaffold1274.1/size127343/10
MFPESRRNLLAVQTPLCDDPVVDAFRRRCIQMSLGNWMQVLRRPWYFLQSGGPARQLATTNQVLYASTETDRLMAFDFSKLPPKCILEGAGGGPLTTDECLVVLSKGQLQLQSYL